MTTAFEEDILAELRERDLEVHELRAGLKRRGHDAEHAETYAALVHLEAASRVRIDAACANDGKARPALWGAR
jgi:hypothetical protein